MDTKNKEIKLKAIVIEEKDYNEYDKLLTLLTSEMGKIKVYAFNVRREKSKNISKTNLFSFGDFTIKETKNGYSFYEVKIIDYFYEIASDYEKYELANKIMEYAKYFSMENIESEKLLKLIVYTLNAIRDNKVDLFTIKQVFKARLLQIEGLAVESADLKNIYNHIDDNLVYTWNEIQTRELKKLYSFELDEDLRHKLERVVNSEYKEKVEKFYD